MNNAAATTFDMEFSQFADGLNLRCITYESNSLLNPERRYKVLLNSSLPISVDFASQSFEESFLLPISKELGCDLKIAAQLLSLRSCWIALIQGGAIPTALTKNIHQPISSGIVTDYFLLTSPAWIDHPWIKERSREVVGRKGCVTYRQAWDLLEWDHWSKEEEGSIWWCIDESRVQRHKKTYASNLERNADYATFDIKQAKAKIQDLHREVEEQEALIVTAKRAIKKLQNSKSDSNKASPGHPKLSDPQEIIRRDWALSFVSQWVNSLMTSLSITSYGELSRVVSGHKMTWLRWHNKEMLPAADSLKLLLDVKIKSGEYQNIKVRDVQTSPSLNDLITLRELV